MNRLSHTSQLKNCDGICFSVHFRRASGVFGKLDL